MHELRCGHFWNRHRCSDFERLCQLWTGQVFGSWIGSLHELWVGNFPSEYGTGLLCGMSFGELLFFNRPLGFDHLPRGLLFFERIEWMHGLSSWFVLRSVQQLMLELCSGVLPAIACIYFLPCMPGWC